MLRDADVAFALPDFSIALASVLRDEPQLVRAWQRWSEDQRWTPSAAIMETRVSWILTSGKAVHELIHTDTGAATADFIRRLSAWLARREVLTGDE